MRSCVAVGIIVTVLELAVMDDRAGEAMPLGLSALASTGPGSINREDEVGDGGSVRKARGRELLALGGVAP